MGELKNKQKRDRTARLTYIEHLLYQNHQGLKIGEISRRCNVCSRTTRRDLQALQDELKIPFCRRGQGMA